MWCGGVVVAVWWVVFAGGCSGSVVGVACRWSLEVYVGMGVIA